MKFPQRLAYYLFGILISSMFLFFFFGKKKTEFCYMPNCRVLKDLRSKPVTYSQEVEDAITQGWVDQEDIRKTLTHGKVDFSKSNIAYKNGKIYVIKGKTKNNEPIILEFVNFLDTAELENISKVDK